MWLLKGLAARRLARRGEHAAALALCAGADPEVLSLAGMHLAVLARESRPSVPRALALVPLGEVDESLAMVRRLGRHPQLRGLLGQLATYLPAQVLPLVSHRPELADIRAYCQLATGFHPDPGRLSPWMAFASALRQGHGDQASRRLQGIYQEQGLETPGMDLTQGRMNLHTIACQAPVCNLPDPPLVSVIFTAYNEEACLAWSVRSILAQSWPNLEVILVNDASTDATLAVAQRLAEEDRRVRVISLALNAGTWVAKNVGLERARGAFLTMHDADDWSHPRKLERQLLPLLNQPELVCTSSYLLRVSEQDGLPFTRNAASLLRWNPCSLLFRRVVVERLGGFFTQLLGGDCEFAGRIETLWGQASHRRLRLPLTLGWQGGDALSSRFRDPAGIRTRLAHWEAWRRFHVDIFLGTHAGFCQGESQPFYGKI